MKFEDVTPPDFDGYRFQVTVTSMDLTRVKSDIYRRLGDAKKAGDTALLLNTLAEVAFENA